MQCRRCGFVTSLGTFCAQCGAPLPVAQAPAAPVPAQPDPQGLPPAPQPPAAATARPVGGDSRGEAWPDPSRPITPAELPDDLFRPETPEAPFDPVAAAPPPQAPPPQATTGDPLVQPTPLQAAVPVADDPPPRRGGMLPVLVVGIAIVIVLGVVLAGIVFPGGLGLAFAPGPQPTAAERSDAAAGSSSAPTAGAATSRATSPTPTPTPSAERPLTDPATKPAERPERVDVSRSGGGKACTETGAEAAWPGYPAARCTIWKAAAGLTSGKPLSTGPTTVACQANLGVANPVFTKNQSNTWWLWGQSDDGTWDWFPETAMAEGTSDAPVDGVALCVARG